MRSEENQIDKQWDLVKIRFLKNEIQESDAQIVLKFVRTTSHYHNSKRRRGVKSYNLIFDGNKKDDIFRFHFFAKPGGEQKWPRRVIRTKRRTKRRENIYTYGFLF